MAREHFKDLTPKQRDSLTSLFQAIAAKVSGDASQSVLSPPEGFYQEQLAEALKALFPADGERRTPALKSDPAAKPKEPKP